MSSAMMNTMLGLPAGFLRADALLLPGSANEATLKPMAWMNPRRLIRVEISVFRPIFLFSLRFSNNIVSISVS